MAKGYLTFVLHAHLPFVRHPEDENFMEELWLYEAITETYIPLIESFERLLWDDIPYRVTFSISPPLLSMLTDPLLQQRYERHLNKLIELVHKEEQRTNGTPFHETVLMYQRRLHSAFDTFVHRYRRNLVQALRHLEEAGRLEVITCAATHGFLPLLVQPSCIRAQVETAVRLHQKHFGHVPRGIWLPECGYTPGLDTVLRENGIKFFFTDTHGVMFASRRPRYGIYAPIYCPAGVAAFGRDVESSKQVWSTQEGYPGDSDYREFYRDIGFDLDYDYIKDYIHHEGIRVHTGLKYYRITGEVDLADKQPYHPAWAQAKADIHAGNFLFNRQRQVEYLSGIMDRAPVIVAPYDAELFGHWWFEGPQWLESLIRKIVGQDIIELVTPSDYLKRYPKNQITQPCPSSWGNRGYNEVWLNQKNDWIYRHLHEAGHRMTELADRFPRAAGDLLRALKQAARELLLAQSSDWAFIMSTGTTVPYAVKRTKSHLANFNGLYEQIKYNRIEPGWLGQLEGKNNIFPDIDYRSWRSSPELKVVV